MTIEERWASSRGARIHYLDAADDAGHRLVPVVFVPGALGTAEDYQREMASLAPRRCVALSLRGRGKSDAPQAGYAFEDQVADLEAVVHHARVVSFCLMAHSAGVPVAIGYAERHPQSLVGLIIGDYPAHYRAIPPDWPERVASSVPTARVRLEVAQALQRESREVLLWGVLPRLSCPTLILRGTRPDSGLKEDDAARYRQYLPAAEVVVLDGAGHELREPDYEKYVRTIRQFLEKLDAGRGP
ncbi:MAG: alpha/beta hydrolase [Armatimonadota bacterium]|nr:alpha/beta hydrolase [Armatimonadota bacterium]